MADASPYRLPRTVEPERYELTLTPDLDAARFTGEERVYVTVRETISVLQLNAAELEIFSVELINEDGVKIAGSVSIDEDSEIATVQLAEPATAGTWTLHATFAGLLGDKLRGFYRSTFIDDNGQKHVIATTQFQATDARRAFPCWDEPDFKAVFSVTLIVEDRFIALSNAAIESEDVLANGKRQVTFADTIKMSTYLVAFVVGPLTITEPIDVDGVPLRIACVPGRERLGTFALEAGSAALRYFSKYFGIPYPSDKLDFIALPDFAAGAMENLGCVTFRETTLLVDTTRASRMEIERVADVVAHETAHMWFGDLVTMKWWNGIWLNEAFATFMELSFVHHFRPDWERWATFGMEKSVAFGIDSLTSTRPIEYPVNHPDEAHGMFDVLTYKKGASVLQMLEQHLGEAEFSRGISAYLRHHAHGNAETTDLWDALEKSSGQPVRAVMDSWISQGGHPIVDVERKDDRTLVLTQRRFTYTNEVDAGQRWQIPVSIRANVDGTLQSMKLLLTDERTEITLPGPATYVVVNERAHGFYRVSYKGQLFQDLLENIEELNALECFALVTDAWAACLARQADLGDTIALVELMSRSDDPNVWGAILAPLRLVDKMADGETREALRAFVRKIATPLHQQLGWEPQQGESERSATLRGTLIAVLGALGNDLTVQEEAARRYAAYCENPSTLNGNLISPVEVVLAHINAPGHYDTVLDKFTSESSTPQEKVNALLALASFTNSALVERTLALIEDGQVRTQDAPFALRAMLGSRTSGARVWEWCESNWDDLVRRFPDNSIFRMLEGTTAHADPALTARVQTFMAAHPSPHGQLSVDQTCERLRVNAAFYEEEIGKLPGRFDRRS